MNTKNILLLGRRDQTEAMRVAAGLTIFGHTVNLVFMGRDVEDTPENRAQAELLELSDIEPLSTLMDSDLPYVPPTALQVMCLEADAVLSI
ncbi:hypothetical protein BI364_06460 [Acidihalobacter yilgarnensis]|uniref:Uncharacterized protein n=1 Tax=Acidihalobacter yilgarnensis TaxID=2819280 RepID=A0A1D8IMF0_9GAMM|nr:hypothetical protein [Acidihalobacter yilgarnensis]AOU97646.1 hypothetical protein BI364_06460 [Acidihalobacter yilgarnensis]